MLNRMLFRGADGADRYKILERFYTLDPGLIERFYAGNTTWWDMMRILSGKPPISVSRAIKAIWSKKK
jgi:lycopene beta-cyclase